MHAKKIRRSATPPLRSAYEASGSFSEFVDWEGTVIRIGDIVKSYDRSAERFFLYGFDDTTREDGVVMAQMSRWNGDEKPLGRQQWMDAAKLYPVRSSPVVISA
jgi:hypothetical protein